MGVNLIDLDFDGTPEVLVSRGEKIDDTARWKQFSDVDIYCIKNSGLEYIDTLYNNDSGLLSDHGNVIGLKMLENGDKKWYTMSRFNRSDVSNTCRLPVHAERRNAGVHRAFQQHRQQGYL